MRSGPVESGGWRLGWMVAAATLPLAVLSAAALHPEVSHLLAVYPMSKGIFADMEAVLAAGEAAAAGWNPYQNPNYFDSYGRPHVYGPAFLAGGSLGLTVAHTALLGALLAVVWLVTLAAWSSPRRLRDALAFWAVMLSPPLLLGLERANNDLIIQLLAAGAAAACAARAPLSMVGAAGLLIGAAWLKIYPVVALFGLGALRAKLRARWWVATSALAVVTVGVALHAPLFKLAVKLAPSPDTVFAYSLAYSGRLLLADLGWALWAGIVGAAGLSFWALRGLRGGGFRVPLEGPMALWLTGSLVMWAGCLAAGSSFFYRALWLAPLCFYAWRKAEGANGEVARRLWLWLIIFLWASWPLYQVIHHLNLGRGWTVFFAGFQHTLVPVSFGLAVWLVTDWGWRRWLRPDPAIGAGADGGAVEGAPAAAAATGAIERQ